MSFPITVSASVGGAEQPGKFATFLNGANRYQVQFVLDAGTSSAGLAVFKSADAGATWLEVDAAHRPQALWSATSFTVPYCCCQVGSSLYVVYLNETFASTMTSFDMTSDTWTALSVDTSSPNGPSPSSAEDGYPLQQYACSYRAATGDIVFVMCGDQISGLGDVFHTICAFCVFNLGTGLWGAWSDLGYLDYGDITTWDLIPCALVTDAVSGRTTVFMQQVARAGPGDIQTLVFTAVGDNTFDVPGDAGPAAEVEVYAAGAGPSNIGGGVSGGGGAGGYSRLNAYAWTPGSTINFHVGAGGVPVTAGDDTWFDSPAVLLAKGGQVGATNLDGGAGGLASGGVGDVKYSGGDGGIAGASGGGGGGGAAGPAGDGGAGFPGGAPLGGPGGAGNAPGGDGGDGGAVTFAGGDGSAPGAGGGGAGGGSPISALLPVGAGGQINLTYLAVRNTNNCRMFQQSIESDNSLGVLAEITQGAYPARAKGVAPVPLSSDAAVFGGLVFISFTGASSTSDRDNIAVGKGSALDPVAFTFQYFNCGNGGDDVDACPSVCAGSAGLYCCYISAPSAGPISFLYRFDAGSGFGAPVAIGTLPLPDVREFGRLQASALVVAPEITFGVPTSAVLQFSGPS